MKDYYKILGVEKNASEDEIKKAFRKQAHIHHPDKGGGDEKKFKEINEAYTVLSNPQKRRNYDQFGSADGHGFGGQGGSGQYGGATGQGFGGFDFSGFQGGFGGQGFGQDGGIEFDLGDIMGDFFGRARGGQGSHAGRASRARGEDIQVDIELSFKDSIFGTERTINLNKTSACEHCKGNGAEPGTDLRTCATCSGK
ncbi:MAG: DnaJ domain-containing protein, partial [Candidatus Pacebacteria bacterium]|nr:DnaJ domain-containing protein [Candidatus Paceibacterota bacterium]